MKDLRYIKYLIPVIAIIGAGIFMMSAFVGLRQLSGRNALRVASFLEQMPVIIIDPGHGGLDGGAVGVDGVVEAGINLEISFILRDLFLQGGFDVVMTREEDISIHDPGVEGVRAQKASDLRNRLEFTEQYTDSIFISIHQNKFGDPNQHGTQVFYGPNHPGSAQLAEIVQRVVVSMLQPTNERQTRRGGDNLFLIYRARTPAILVEGGFLSNPEEARALMEPEYQAKLAFAVFGAVVEYLGMELPVSFS